MKKWNIRIRLTLLFLGIEVIFLSVFVTSVYWLFTHRLMDAVDFNLHDKLEALAASYEWKGRQVEVELGEHNKNTVWADSIAQILKPDGKVVFQNQPGPTATLLEPSIISLHLKTNELHLAMGNVKDRGEMRIGWQLDRRESRPVVVAVGVPLQAMRHQQRTLLRVMLTAGAALLMASIILGWLVIGRLLRPLADMAKKARQITADRLHDRLDVTNAYDEIGQLAITLNDMMERLGASFDEMRRFTSDASHELRTPLTCMRSELEVALTQPRSLDEYRDVLGSILEEIDRLTKLSNALLTLARLDAGRVKLESENIDLNELVAETADRIRVQADAKGASLQIHTSNGPCRITGNRRLLEQVFLNLLDNAIKYGGNEIQLRISSKDGAAIVTVHDSGRGIPAEALEHVFERFYRVDKSRSRELGGAGLGLSLSKHFVELHGGRIMVQSGAGQGTAFEVVMHCAMES